MLLSIAGGVVEEALQDERIKAALKASEAEAIFIEIGADIAREFHELITVLQADCAVLDSFQGFKRADILAASEIGKRWGGGANRFGPGISASCLSDLQYAVHILPQSTAAIDDELFAMTV